MLKCIIENAKGNQLEFNDETKYQLYEVDGLYPPNASISSSNNVGDGSIIHKEHLLSNLNTCTFSDKNDLSSFSLGLAGLNAYNQNTNFDLMPLYLRKSQAERALGNK